MDNQPTTDLNPEDLIKDSTNVTSSAKSMREYLDDIFSGSDLVTIKNFMDTDTGWVFADPKKERIEQPDKSTRRVYHPDREAKVLKPGQTITIPGWQAYVALNRMWKHYAQLQGSQTGATLLSTLEMSRFIEKAYLGIFDPNSQKLVKKDVAIKSGVQVADIDPLAIAQDSELGFDEPVNAKKTAKA